MKRALLFVAVAGLFGCDGCVAAPRAEAEPPRPLLVIEAPRTPAPTAALPAAAALASQASTSEPEEDWGNAALNCEGRDACLAAAARVPRGHPADIAANVRAKANGASGRCLVEALMVAWNDDAEASCDADAQHAASAADERLIRATPLRAARAWRRLEQEQARATASKSR